MMKIPHFVYSTQMTCSIKGEIAKDILRMKILFDVILQIVLIEIEFRSFLQNTFLRVRKLLSCSRVDQNQG